MKTVRILGVIFLFFTFASGWMLGYYYGAVNQVYFDAPARISMLNRISNDNEKNDVLEGLILRERCVLSDLEYSNTFTALHPVHEETRFQFERLIGKVCEDELCGCTYSPHKK